MNNIKLNIHLSLLFILFSFCQKTFSLTPPSSLELSSVLNNNNFFDNNLYRNHIWLNSKAQILVEKRYKFLVDSVNFPELIRTRLKGMRDQGYEKLKQLTDPDIDECVIILFGDYLWHSEGDKVNDLDVIIILKNSNKKITDVPLYNIAPQLPDVAISYIAGSDVLKEKDSPLRKKIHMIMSGGGRIVGGDRTMIETNSDFPVNERDLLKWSNDLIESGFMARQMGDELFGGNRKAWKRYFDAYLYLYPLVEKYIQPEDKDTFETLIFEDNLSIFFQTFILGQIKKLPWKDEDILTFLNQFESGLEDMIRIIREKIGSTSLENRTIAITVKNQTLYLYDGEFPDHELHLRLLDPEKIKDKDVTVTCAIKNADDLVKTVLLLDLLKLEVYGVKSVNLVLTSIPKKRNKLMNLLGYYCDTMCLKKGERQIRIRNIRPEAPVTRKMIPRKNLQTVLCLRKRLSSDVSDAVRMITGAQVTAKTIAINKKSANPLTWEVVVQNGLTRGEHVALVHACDTNEDIAELWVMLGALRRMGAGSVTLINTHEAYARQDKLPDDPYFKMGEGVSALTMLKTTDLYVDYHMGINVHYAEKSGFVKLDKYELYNLNLFVPLAEKLYEEIVRIVGEENIRERLKSNPLFILAPDDGAFPFVEEAAEQLSVYLHTEKGINTAVECGHLDKTRLGDSTTRMEDYVVTKDGSRLTDMSKYWILMIDDETSTGSTILGAVYKLVRTLHADWRRIIPGVVKGKLAGKWWNDFDSGLTVSETLDAQEPKKVNEEKQWMPARCFPFTTRATSVPKKYPRNQIVSMEDVLYHALQHLVMDIPSRAILIQMQQVHGPMTTSK